jgi:hypothetical protein
VVFHVFPDPSIGLLGQWVGGGRTGRTERKRPPGLDVSDRAGGIVLVLTSIMSGNVAATDVYGSGDGGDIWDRSTIRCTFFRLFSDLFRLFSTANFDRHRL